MGTSEDFMKLPHRRRFLHLAASAAALPAVSRIALAQTYPSRPVNIIVGFPADSGVTEMARIIGQWLSERLGQPFNVENRLGAGTNVATEAVVRAPADGYTLLLASAANAINATLYEKLNFTFISDITPVAGLTRVPIVMVVAPSFPAKTVPEFIAYARANPGTIKMASSFTGSPPHLSAVLFEIMTGLNMPHVAYRSDGASLIDLIAGRIEVVFPAIGATIPGLGTAIEYIRSGKLRALAVTTATRSEALVDIPTVSEFVPGYEASAWFGVGAPKNTPVERVNKLNQEINAGLADSKTRAWFVELGYQPMAVNPNEFGRFAADETEKFAKVVKLAGIKPA
jgi:tripartite-type tricarboxylate transporter receptor subunit TctC